MLEHKVAKIDDKMIAEAKSQIGKEIVPRRRQWHQVANSDAIWHCARGVGDDNPLWCDEQYAIKTRWGSLIAPPSYVYACERGGILQRLFPGAHALWAGDDLEFFAPIYLNDRVDNTVALVSVEERPSKFAGTVWEQLEKLTYRNQHGKVVATIHRHFFKYERTETPRKSKYTSELELYHYTSEELKAIEQDVFNEQVRGAVPRYWEDVHIGDELTPVVKGPLTITDFVAYEMGLGGSPFTLPHELAYKYWRQHPAAAMIDRETGTRDFPIAVHWVDALARDVGLPAAYDIGAQRITWLCHLMTNWIGDDGFLAKLSVQLRAPNLRGDTNWCKGIVTGKQIEGNVNTVKCDVWSTDQRGRTTSKGQATVYLPSKERGPVVLPQPLTK